MRIGLINSLSDEGAVSLRTCDVVVCKDAEPATPWGRAKCFSIASDTRERLGRGVSVITGSSGAKLAKAVIGDPAPTVIVVVKTKVKKTGPVAEAIARVERAGRKVFVAVMGSKFEPAVLDTGTLEFSEPDAVVEREIPYVPSKFEARERNVPRVPSAPKQARKRKPPRVPTGK